MGHPLQGIAGILAQPTKSSDARHRTDKFDMRSLVAYCRSACEPQGGPSAADRQVQMIRGYAEHRGLTLDAIYTDAGVSGATLERPALQRLIADCRAGKIGTVITKDTDRLSRDRGQLFALLHIFGTTGVRIEFSTLHGQSDRFLESVLSAIAELEKASVRGDNQDERAASIRTRIRRGAG
jgi:site-specific DNA recombinase